jgi:hypothetical protein
MRLDKFFWRDVAECAAVVTISLTLFIGALWVISENYREQILKTECEKRKEE